MGKILMSLLNNLLNKILSNLNKSELKGKIICLYVFQLYYGIMNTNKYYCNIQIRSLNLNYLYSEFK
jgi:hypothetical protein